MNAAIPEKVLFATKPKMAVAMLETLLTAGAPRHVVLADTGSGVDGGFREALAVQRLDYVMGITAATVVWPPGMPPLPPKPYVGNGQPLTRMQRAPGHAPLSVKELEASLPARAWQLITRLKSSTAALSNRLSARRARFILAGYSMRWRTPTADELPHFIAHEISRSRPACAVAIAAALRGYRDRRFLRRDRSFRSPVNQSPSDRNPRSRLIGIVESRWTGMTGHVGPE